MGSEYTRSPELMKADDTVLVVIDVQERLAPHITGHEKLVSNVKRLLKGAKLAGIPVTCTEQYPKGLGATLEELQAMTPQRLEKLSFSCMGSDGFREQLEATERRKVLLCGMETHVCVSQTAHDLLASGYSVYVAVDAVGSRYSIDHEIAIRRLEASGVTVCSTEASLFEWCEQAGTDLFREIRKLFVGA